MSLWWDAVSKMSEEWPQSLQKLTRSYLLKRQCTRKPGIWGVGEVDKPNFLTPRKLAFRCSLELFLNRQFSRKFWKSETICFHPLPGFLVHCLLRGGSGRPVLSVSVPQRPGSASSLNVLYLMMSDCTLLWDIYEAASSHYISPAKMDHETLLLLIINPAHS